MILKMAFRNVFRQKRRSLFTILSMFGGFVMAAFFIGFADGSYNNIIDAFTRARLGHIQIHHREYLENPSLYRSIENPGVLGAVLDNTAGVTHWTPRVFSACLVAAEKKSVGAQIVGIDPEKENNATGFNKKIIEGRTFSSPDAKEAVLGKGLAHLLQVTVDQDVVVVTQGADGSIANERYRVSGIMDSGNEISDRTTFYLPINEARDLLVLGKRVHEIAIVVNRLKDVDAITDSLRQRLDDPLLQVAPWQEFARAFYKAMKADQEGMWIMLVIIVLVVSVGILNTVLMSVLERQREYGMLRAVGTRPGQIIRLVLTEVIILALFCIVAGSIVSLLINHLLSINGMKLMEGFSYGGMTFETFKTEVNLRSFTIPAITVLISAAFVSFFPALKAARTNPARSMRIH